MWPIADLAITYGDAMAPPGYRRLHPALVSGDSPSAGVWLWAMRLDDAPLDFEGAAVTSLQFGPKDAELPDADTWTCLSKPVTRGKPDGTYLHMQRAPLADAAVLTELVVQPDAGAASPAPDGEDSLVQHLAASDSGLSPVPGLAAMFTREAPELEDWRAELTAAQHVDVQLVSRGSREWKSATVRRVIIADPDAGEHEPQHPAAAGPYIEIQPLYALAGEAYVVPLASKKLAKSGTHSSTTYSYGGVYGAGWQRAGVAAPAPGLPEEEMKAELTRLLAAVRAAGAGEPVDWAALFGSDTYLRVLELVLAMPATKFDARLRLYCSVNGQALAQALSDFSVPVADAVASALKRLLMNSSSPLLSQAHYVAMLPDSNWSVNFQAYVSNNAVCSVLSRFVEHGGVAAWAARLWHGLDQPSLAFMASLFLRTHAGKLNEVLHRTTTPCLAAGAVHALLSTDSAESFSYWVSPDPTMATQSSRAEYLTMFLYTADRALGMGSMPSLLQPSFPVVMGSAIVRWGTLCLQQRDAAVRAAGLEVLEVPMSMRPTRSAWFFPPGLTHTAVISLLLAADSLGACLGVSSRRLAIAPASDDPDDLLTASKQLNEILRTEGTTQEDLREHYHVVLQYMQAVPGIPPTQHIAMSDITPALGVHPIDAEIAARPLEHPSVQAVLKRAAEAGTFPELYKAACTLTAFAARADQLRPLHVQALLQSLPCPAGTLPDAGLVDCAVTSLLMADPATMAAVIDTVADASTAESALLPTLQTLAQWVREAVQDDSGSTLAVQQPSVHRLTQLALGHDPALQGMSGEAGHLVSAAAVQMLRALADVDADVTLPVLASVHAQVCERVVELDIHNPQLLGVVQLLLTTTGAAGGALPAEFLQPVLAKQLQLLQTSEALDAVPELLPAVLNIFKYVMMSAPVHTQAHARTQAHTHARARFPPARHPLPPSPDHANLPTS